MSLARIRPQLEALTVEQLKALVPPKPAPGLPDVEPPPPPEPSYPFMTWEVVELLPGLALIVNLRRPAARRLADDIYRHYRGAEIGEWAGAPRALTRGRPTQAQAVLAKEQGNGSVRYSCRESVR